MNLEDIRLLVAQGESETLEFKATTGGRREAARTVCAMLNHRGGLVLFGVTPDGQVVGQSVSGRTVERVTDELRRIDPPAFPAIDRIPVEGERELVILSVTEGAAKPYQYRGTAYRRIGNTSPPMPAEEYQRVLLERAHSEQRWENRLADGWTEQDLDAAEIRRTVEEAIRRGRLDDPGTRETGELLRGMRLLRDGRPMRAAAVLFGETSRLELYMPQCLLRVARFRGTDRTEFLDNRQFHGNAFALLGAAERFLRQTLPIAGRIEPDRIERVDEPPVPPLAVREALANAFCHRDYSIGGGSVGVAIYDDRLEVTSSGSLHFGLTPEMLFAPHESLPWNPHIARAFYLRGIIEEWGRGTLRMEAEALAAGLPRLEIDDAGGCVTVRFWYRTPLDKLVAPDRSGTTDTVSGRVPDRGLDGLTELQRAIVDILDAAAAPLALREFRARLPDSISERQVRRALARLRNLGLIHSTGRGATARWTLSDDNTGGT